MKLTTYTNYALRTLTCAALKSPGLCNITEVSQGFGISRAHIVKCVHQLGAWGYLENVRGRNGGFRLAKPANEITVGEIVRKTEDSLNLVECFDPETNTCPLISVCKLSQLFKRATANFLAELDAVTLADVTTQPDELIALLSARSQESKVAQDQ